MFSLRKALCRGTAIAVLAFAAAGFSASASPITFTEQAQVTGSFGGIAFTDTSIVLTMNTDTTTVIGGGSFFSTFGTLTAYVGSALPVTLMSSLFFNANGQAVGFNPGPDLLDVTSPLLASYDLTTLIGPITGDGLFNAGHNFTTSGGALRLDALNSQVTFTATATPYVPGGTVPEPLTLSLFAAGLAGFAGMRRKAQ